MDIKSLVRTIDGFPKPGIAFKDITPVLSDPKALRWVVDQVCERYRGRVDGVVGIESRGFIFGAPVAYALGVGLTIIRKPGKLPHDTHTVEYQLEYGSDSLEIHTDALPESAPVVLVDDLLATGGTAKAAVNLLEKVGARVVECAFLIELAGLGGAAKLAPLNAFSLVTYTDE